MGFGVRNLGLEVGVHAKGILFLKSMLFYYPVDLAPTYRSGSTLRPAKMVEAFRAIGYEVTMVQGSSTSRKLSMQQVLKSVRSGRQEIEFVYMELPNVPLTLSNANHWPPAPFADFRYLRALRALGIRIGIFVRDIFWMFPSQMTAVPSWKRMMLAQLFGYDYWRLSSIADVTFVPSLELAKRLPDHYAPGQVVALPPGADPDPCKAVLRDRGEGLRVLYVGSVAPPTYDITPLLRAIQLLKMDAQVSFNICCYEDQWNRESPRYANKGLNPLEMPNLEVVHLWGDEVAQLYARADIALIVLEENDYMRIAMPIKLFEALGYRVPVVVNRGTPFGNFVDETGIGWTIEPRGEVLADLIQEISRGSRTLHDIHAAIVSALGSNTWESRARLVANSLRSERST